MKIVLLSGKPNTGKTTTLNLVYNSLLSSSAHILQPRSILGSNPNDFECILSYTGKVVAIYSAGDLISDCYSAIVKYCYCDTLVLAYSDKFSNSLAQLVSACPMHVVINKSHGNPSTNNINDCSLVIQNI